MMKLVQMLQMLIMRSLNASCGICGFANEFGIFLNVSVDGFELFSCLYWSKCKCMGVSIQTVGHQLKIGALYIHTLKQNIGHSSDQVGQHK